MTGDPDRLYVEARRVLLDAIEALHGHLDALILVGAQAIYLHTGEAAVAIAPYTTDADLVLDPSKLKEEPRLEDALRSAGFTAAGRDRVGVWRADVTAVTVDLLVPEAVADPSGRRAARLGAHGKAVARKTQGLEGAIVDNVTMLVTALDLDDRRRYEVRVAGPSALLVAKLFKLHERRERADRLADKDAVDVLRLLRAVPTTDLADGLMQQLADQRSSVVARNSLRFLEELFGNERGVGARLAARSLDPLEEPATVIASATLLSRDVLDEVKRSGA